MTNNSGELAFTNYLDSGQWGLYTSNGNANNYTTYSEAASGPYYLFSGSALALNNDGGVAFRAVLDAGGYGLFVGPDPLTDELIGNGDLLDGKVVWDVSMGPHGYNDAGQLAFWAYFTDGSNGIYLASPASASEAVVPEPSSLALVLLGAVPVARRRRRQR